MSIARFALIAMALASVQVALPAVARTLKPRMHHRYVHVPRRPVTSVRAKPKPSMPHTLGSGDVPPTKP